METIIKEFELQIDEKQNDVVIRLNDEKGCVLRICGIPKEQVFEPNGERKPFIDLSWKDITKQMIKVCYGTEFGMNYSVMKLDDLESFIRYKSSLKIISLTYL
jgi:hypothetical protein